MVFRSLRGRVLIGVDGKAGYFRSASGRGPSSSPVEGCGHHFLEVAILGRSVGETGSRCACSQNLTPIRLRETGVYSFRKCSQDTDVMKEPAFRKSLSGTHWPLYAALSILFLQCS